MLSKSEHKLLKFMRENKPDFQRGELSYFSYKFLSTQNNIEMDVLPVLLMHMKNCGYLEYVDCNDENHHPINKSVGIRLSYKAMFPLIFYIGRIRSFLASQWIALIALVLSIVTFIKTYYFI